MSNTYDTSMYPLGSTHPKVLFNNASNLDDGSMNNVTSRTWADRFGRNRKSWWGFEQDFNDFLVSSGFEPLHLTYVDGSPLQVDRATQLIDRAGSVYRVKMPSTFPVMLTGTWATDQNLLVDVGDASLRQALASSSGADLVFSGARSLQDRVEETVNLLDFANPADADSTAGVLAFIAKANTLPRANMIIPVGEFKISAVVTFDVPDFSTIQMFGTFMCLTGGRIVLGSAVRNTFGIDVYGMDVIKTGFSTGAAYAGLTLQNMAFSQISIKRVNNFQTGILVTGTQPNGGFSYNQIWLGLIHDNQYNLFLTASGSGYTNENVFNGGSFNHSSGYPAVDTANIYVSDYVAHSLNSNRFMFPSLEDNAPTAVGARIEGVSNVLFMPRLENPSDLTGYGVVLPSNSRSCHVVGGYGMRATNVFNAGLYNRVETLDGITLDTQGTTPALALRNQASSSTVLISGKDSANVETFSLTGNGDIAAKKIACTELKVSIIPVFADNAAALAGGLAVGRAYRTSTGVAMWVY